MIWHGYTPSDHITAGTRLHIVQAGAPAGSAGALTVGTEVEIDLGAGGRTIIVVTETGPHHANIFLPDGSVWTMTPHSAEDGHVATVFAGAHFQNWIVRAARPAVP